MRDKRKYCRPVISKYPKTGDIIIKLKCGKYAPITQSEYNKVKNFFKPESFVGEDSPTDPGNIVVIDKNTGKQAVFSTSDYNSIKDDFEISSIVGNKANPSTGDITAHNSVLNTDGTFSYNDWLELSDDWELTGLYGITTYEEANAQDGDLVILANGHTLIISPDDYSKVSDNWEQVDIIVTGQVDLGLPSGTIWSTVNIGAQTPYQRGTYFSWGNLEGYVASYNEGDYQGEIVGYSFIQDNYELTNGYLLSGSIPVESDAAYDNSDEEWRIPTDTQFQELIDNCTITWVEKNGVPGKLFTSNINGKSLFLINNGYGNATTLDSPKYQTAYWTNVEDEVNTNKALSFVLGPNILPNLTPVHPEEKRFGFGIRAVKIPL